MTTATHPARRLWQQLEALHGIVYFAPEVTDALKGLGLKGFWMCYFAGRAAPLGAVGPGPVEASFYNFEPAMVRRAIPDAWRFAEPPAVVLDGKRVEADWDRETGVLAIDADRGADGHDLCIAATEQDCARA